MRRSSVHTASVGFVPAAPQSAWPAWSRAGTVAAYVLVFLAALPAVLFQLGLRLDRWLALPEPSAGARALGGLVGVFAAARMVHAMVVLSRRGRGLPISHLPPHELVAVGRYARVRHPIYLAFTRAFAGLALALSSTGAAFGASPVLVLAWLAYVRLFEEPGLRARFGERYRSYAAATALIVPLPERALALAARLWRALAPSIERLANRTVAWRSARLSLVTYGQFVAAGAFAMTLWSGASLGVLGVGPSRFAPFAVGVGLAMLAGGRLAGLLYRPELLWRAPFEALRTVGFVSWGGYAGLFAAAVLGARWLGLPAPLVLDRLLLPALLCSAIGRFGCLSYGCCGGRPWAHGITWRDPDARIVRELGREASVPRVPTQLLSSGLALGLALILMLLTTRPLPPGALTAFGVLVYGLGRASVESTREEARYGRWCLTRGQLASLGLAALGLVATLGLPDAAGSWPVPAWRAPASAWLDTLPTALVCGTLVLLVTGVHGRRIGRW